MFNRHIVVRRPQVVAAIAGFLSIVGSTGNVLAYGPGVHMREGQTYLQTLEDGLPPDAAQADLDLLSDEENVVYLLIGSVFPDVGRQVESIGFEPHRLDVADHLLSETANPSEQDERLRAFALGNASHVTADVSAQVFLVPYLTASTDIGVVDVLIDAFDGAGGENEFFVEAIADVYVGDLHSVVDVLYMLTDWAEQPTDIRPVMMDYYTLVGDLLGELPLTPEQFADNVDVFLASVMEYLVALSPEAAHALVDDIVSSSAAEFLDVLAGAGGAIFQLGGVSMDANAIDRAERQRLEANRFLSDPELYQVYDDYFGQLGPAFLRDHFDTAEVFENWRTWHGPPLLASNLQSLAWYLPDTHYPDAAVLIWELGFKDSEGQTLSRLDGQNLPDEARAVAVVYPSTDEASTVRMEIRGHLPGFDIATDPSFGEVSLSLPGQPGYGAPPHRDTLSLTFDPSSGSEDVIYYYAIFYNDDRTEAEGLPFLTTLEEPFVAIDEIDMTGAAWTPVFDGSSGWQPTLPVDNPPITSTDSYLDIRVRNLRFPRQGVPNAIVELESDGVVVGSVTTNSVGRLPWGPVTPGSHRLVNGSADGFVWLTDSEAIVVAAGETAVVEASLDPVVLVEDSGDYMRDRTRIYARIEDLLRFSTGQVWEYKVSFSSEEPASDWLTSETIRINHELEPPAQDGDVLYVFVRAAATDTLPVGQVARSDGVTVDGTPPSQPEVTVDSTWNISRDLLEGSVSSSDAISSIASYLVVVIGNDGEGLEFIELPGGTSSGFQVTADERYQTLEHIELLVTAFDGAGLASEATTVVVEIEMDEPEYDVVELVEWGAETVDVVEEPDVGPDLVDSGGSAETTETTEDGCGCAATKPRINLVSLFLLAGLVIGWRLRQPTPN